MLRSANVAYCATLAGVAIGYLELLRPGMVIPGVAGAVLAMLGLASLWDHAWNVRGAALLLAGLAAAAVDARLRLRGVGAAAGAAAMTMGARWLVAEEPARIRWTVAAGASVPFLLSTWWLLERALLARANKTDF